LFLTACALAVDKIGWALPKTSRISVIKAASSMYRIGAVNDLAIVSLVCHLCLG